MSGERSKGFSAAALGVCAGGLALVALFVAAGLACDGAARLCALRAVPDCGVPAS
jgi:hypothetical protein